MGPGRSRAHVGRQLGEGVDSGPLGGVVVGGIDNLIYPILVGNRLKLHTIPAFMAIVGGLIVFGPSGLILGPTALTVTIVLLELWKSRTRETDQGSVRSSGCLRSRRPSDG